MKTSFQTGIIIVFSIAFVIAVAVFSGIFSSNSNQADKIQGTVVAWGILPESVMNGYISDFNARGGDYTVAYTEIPAKDLAQTLTVALANGYPPDVLFLSSETFEQFKDKLYTIPFSVLSERTYRDTNVDGAQIFLNTEGTYAIPLVVDPLVVYYNKDILASAVYALPPRTWNDLVDAVPRLTKRSPTGAITQSTIALGDPVNVSHFKDILSALFIQSGNPIVAYDASIGVYETVLDGGAPIDGAVDYFNSFADPSSGSYSWNRSFPKSIDMFIAGKTAFYIGRASELFTIQSQNPNLNFDVMELFQPQEAVRPLTFGSFTGVSLMKSAPNFTTAYAFVAELSGSFALVDDLSKRLSLPPVRRDLILQTQQNPYVSTFFKAALGSFAWYDPNAVGTENALYDMINTIISGRSDTMSAINEAQRKIQSYVQ